MTPRAFDVKPLRGPWHLAPNPYSARYIPGTNRLYQRAALGCLPGGAGHGGRDIDADSDDRVLRAVWAGKVHRYGWDDFGNHLGVINSDGHEAFYAHLSVFHVADGVSVQPDQDLGILGSTGNVTGPHCHFEIRTTATDWCTAIDPTNWLMGQPQPQGDDDMFLFKKSPNSTVYQLVGTGLIAVVTAHTLQELGQALGHPPKVYTLASGHDFYGYKVIDPNNV